MSYYHNQVYVISKFGIIDGVSDLSMGLEMDFDRNRTVGLSPNTVLPTHRHSFVEKRSTKGKSKRKDDLLSIKEDFVEISFHRYHSSSGGKRK
ncbi:uncharacterized protein Pyn_13026 [Prunus yedoensis var. nudiflora]|uniref:Uncharacterized protein n=1 Tax=Prunus yedoensis var. nudiflora TaxID=2094558 RepID=A0A314UD30_PRUYE|nr:uncharacterized protein Pyn_13026 [Prunus yedoensis var. nudiflora]